jgi:Family of unknown function (DUF5946)
MSVVEDSVSSGCGLSMPARHTTAARSHYNVSAECWDLYTEVLGTEYSNASLFGQIHQLTVDTYAVQHAGGPHPDKSVDVREWAQGVWECLAKYHAEVARLISHDLKGH